MDFKTVYMPSTYESEVNVIFEVCYLHNTFQKALYTFEKNVNISVTLNEILTKCFKEIQRKFVAVGIHNFLGHPENVVQEIGSAAQKRM